MYSHPINPNKLTRAIFTTSLWIGCYLLGPSFAHADVLSGSIDTELNLYGENSIADRLWNEGSGTLNNNGTLTNNGMLDNDGTLHNKTGSLLQNNNFLRSYGGSTLNNDGSLINAAGATLQSEGTLTNENNLQNAGALTNAGSLINRGYLENTGTLDNYQTLQNDGSFGNVGTLNNMFIFENNGSIYNDGTIDNDDGQLTNNGTINNRGMITLSERWSTLDGTGTFEQTRSEASLTVNGTMTQSSIDIYAGSIGGSGTITSDLSIFDSGSLGPGNSPGSLTIDGDLTMSDGSIVFELGGITQGTEYDFIDVSGTATLDGELVVEWFDLGEGLYSASLGDSFDLLAAETISGDFYRLTLAPLDDGLAWD